MGNSDQLTITGATSEQEATLREIIAWPGVPDLARPITINVGEGFKTFAGATGISFDSNLISNLPNTGYPLLHEYGHVWDRQWLSIEDRQEIVDRSGSPYSWLGGPYNECPAERFADTFSKIVMASAGYQVGAALAFTGSVYDDIATRIAEVHSTYVAVDALIDSPFTDIGNLSKEMQEAIVWLHDRGITKGTTLTTFSPDEPVTRGQMALFLYRARR